MKKISLLVICLGFALACTKKKAESTAPTSNVASAVVSNLSSVSQNLTPGALATSSASTMAADFCSGTQGMVDCQPRFLKQYLAVAKQQLDSMITVVGEIGTSLGELPDGATGDFRGESGDTGSYSKTDSDTFWILMKVNGTNAAYLAVDGGSYTLELDGPAIGNASAGKYASTVNYVDSTNWTITATIAGASCDPLEVRSPQNIQIQVSKAGALWTGKAMIFAPRWAIWSPEPTCASTPSTATSFNMYSDFVADDNVAKMNVYTAKSDKTTITSYPIAGFCTEYSSLCTGGVFGAETPASYLSPVCVTASSGAANWNSNCSAQDASSAVPSASFGSPSDWIQPNVFQTQSITVGP